MWFGSRNGRQLSLSVLALGATVVLAGLPAQAETQRPGAYPGLPAAQCIVLAFPEYECVDGTGQPDPLASPTGGYFNLAQIGLAGSVPAKQWVRIPLTMLTAGVNLAYPSTDDGTTSTSTAINDIQATLVSPKGQADNYGASAIIPVRTVAFGSLPVEARLQVSQARDDAGQPYPIQFRSTQKTTNNLNDGSIQFDVQATRIRTDLKVAVRSLEVDGVPVTLDGSCATPLSADLDVSSRPVKVFQEAGYQTTGTGNKLEDTIDTTKDWLPVTGGTFNGSLDIPQFRTCRTTSGDDLSALLTAAISGPRNPVSLKVGYLGGCYVTDENGNFRPTAPGVNNPADPGAGCRPSGSANPGIVTVPKIVDIPSTAPTARP